jgi:hypothetical protein
MIGAINCKVRRPDHEQVYQKLKAELEEDVQPAEPNPNT